MPFVDDIAQHKRTAGQRALLEADGLDNAGGADGYGLGIFGALLGRSRAVERIADGTGAGQLHGHAVHTFKNTVRREADRLYRYAALTAGIRFAGAGLCKIEPAVLPVHAAEAALIRDIAQGGIVDDLPAAAQIELFARGVERKRSEIICTAAVVVRTAEDNDRPAGCENGIGQSVLVQILETVRQAIARERNVGIGNVFKLDPVAVAGSASIIGLGIRYHDLAYNERIGR